MNYDRAHTNTYRRAVSIFETRSLGKKKIKNEIRINNMILRSIENDRMGDGSIYVIGSRGYMSADRVARLAGHCTL